MCYTILNILDISLEDVYLSENIRMGKKEKAQLLEEHMTLGLGDHLTGIVTVIFTDIKTIDKYLFLYK